MAEDEEDESFGDFHFASFPNPTVHSIPPQNNGQNSAFLWGEFIATPKSDLSDGPAHNLSPPPNSDTAEPDPRVPNRSESEKALWVKPRGALPLSIFGELEEEAEEEKASGAGESTVGGGGVLFSENKNGNSEIKESPLNVNHLIANSYGQNQQMRSPNGSDLNLNGSDMNTNGMNSNMNGLDSDLVDGNEGFDDDDDGWEFKAAEPEFGTGNRNPKIDSKELESLASVSGNCVDGPDNLFLVSNGTSNRSGEGGFGLDFNSSALNLRDGFISGSFSQSKDNDTANWINSSEADKKVDSVEDLWEFKDAFHETGSKNKLEVPKVDDISLAGLEAKVFNGDDASGYVDLFAVSDGVLQNSRKWDSGFNFNPSFMNSNSIILDSRAKGKQNDLISSLVDKNVGANENFWDFRGVHSESGSEHKSEMPKVVDSSPAGVEALSYDVNFASNTKDSWLASDAVSPNPVEWEFGINFYPVTKEDIISGSYNKSKPNGLNTSPVDENDESDENFGEFKDAFSETGPKHEEEYKVADSSPAGVEVPASSVEVQKDEVRSQNHRGPLPMSIFSDRDLDSLILKEASTVTPGSNPKDSIKSAGSNVSINDLISSLYSQAEQNALVNNAPNASDHGMHSTITASESHTVNNDDDFDDYSWDFKAAISGIGAKDQSSDVDLGDSLKKLSATLEISDCVDFYCKLKDELCSIVLCHLDNLKKAQSTAALSGEEAKANCLDEEIKEFYNELNKDNLISEEVQSENISQRETSLSDFLEVLQGPKFHAIGSEYQLVKRLSLAEKDARSAVELLKDVTSNITILKLGSIEEQQYYVSTWSNMLSVCIQELKDGALIWKQSVRRNIQSQILSEPQGKQYILALGEIYRVVEVLGASTRLYRPWIFLSSSYASGLIDLLCECYTIWSSSGLEDSLKSISDLLDFEDDGTVEALLESINYMHNIDALTLQKHVFSGQPICRLSALTAGSVPGLRQVVWNGEHYFLTLANMWANRISCDPPKLPGSAVADDEDCPKRILEAS